MPATLIDIADQYVVLRPFSALGRTVGRGEVLDCSEWRNVQPLVNTRRLAPLYSPEGRSALPADFGMDSATDDEGDDENEDEPVGSSVTSVAPVQHRRPGRPRKEVA